jgi:hypothetical protein
MKVAEQVADLRYLLAVAEARRQIGERKAAPRGFLPVTQLGATPPAIPLWRVLPALKWFRVHITGP